MSKIMGARLRPTRASLDGFPRISPPRGYCSKQQTSRYPTEVGDSGAVENRRHAQDHRRQLGAILDVHLEKDVGEVFFQRSDADLKCFRDLLIDHTDASMLRHLDLACRQSRCAERGQYCVDARGPDGKISAPSGCRWRSVAPPAVHSALSAG